MCDLVLARTHPQSTDPPSPAQAISRFALDARLAELFVSEGGHLSTRTCASPPANPSGWIQTSGRCRGGPSKWVGLKVHARGIATIDGPEIHLGDGAYVGLSAVEDGWINVCGLFSLRPGLQFGRGQALPVHLAGERPPLTGRTGLGGTYPLRLGLCRGRILVCPSNQ